MIVYGYVKQSRYSGDNAYEVQVRIPNIHGPYKRSDATGTKLKNYVEDSNLPYYPSVILPYEPNDGAVVALSSTGGDTSSDFIVIGLTGASYGSSSNS